ncbi:unnamed protein product [Parnassius apollo]|uniref:(apollo) hypothetical protein n=1 Tax=Parnassius apollo TaxID=110799 RepID=A0A8S3XJQ2_PARAO|nr:unnamed protein product [Parnassius apollo]
MDKLATYHSKQDFKKFWKSTNKLNVGPSLPEAVNGVSDMKQIADFFRDHFMVTSPLGPSSHPVSNAETKRELKMVASDKMISRVIKTMVAENHCMLHDGQHGFSRGLSTETAIMSLKHTVKYYTDRRTPVYACFLDLSKAFDLVSYNILWRKLEGVGLPCGYINLLKYWYSNQVNYVRWANEYSEPYRMECGVRQWG